MAWGLNDLIGLMDRWGVWKEVRANADRVPELERRIAELESRLQRAPGEACPACGEFDFRAKGSGPPVGGHAAKAAGAREYRMECGACGFKDRKTVWPEQLVGRRR